MNSLNRLEGKVALVTGAARGQGRSHAVRFAEEGADIIALDWCTDNDILSYALATEADLDETVRLVESLDRRIVSAKADVRDAESVRGALAPAVAELGHLDIVCANAGISTGQAATDVTPHVWEQTIATNLTGVWNAFTVALPYLIANGGGSMIATGSTAGVKGLPFFGPYTASKFGVVGIAKSLANEFAPHNIRVNVVHPTGVYTPLRDGLFESGLNELIRSNDSYGAIFMNTLPVQAVDPVDISNAMVYLASDESRYVTGVELSVDAGNTIR